ncbi:tyrosine-type recombinase/integrase [Terriglobus albidus]|uniref:Tyrosine-type recombinase/integrase n=1 Tax=Terriglobus albidus TaxID=1592106 RepID=A0A5B9ECX5_9BACT|nr:integrase arm-type DNA-binding domain-containing protein [Terriglobus albidus]QEE28570.1 tyrosine-type recombinase/integrase [Terriglobus albidus]
MRSALSDAKVKQAKAGTTAWKITDGGGLFLLVTPSGGKLWRWKYRYQGKAKLMALGQYPDVSLTLARELHRKGRELLATGVDPMAQRKADKLRTREADENSFATVAAKWLEHWRVGKSVRHWGTVSRRLKADILPILGACPIGTIGAPDVVAVAKAIEGRGPTDLPKRSLQYIGQIFRYAIAHGYATRNPASEVKPGDILKSTQTVNQACIDAKELPDLLKAIEVYRGTQMTRLAFKLMALTFVRTAELVGAKWSEFDLAAARWDIPAERMKLKAPHIVPLARQTIEVLESLRLISGDSEYLFPKALSGAARRSRTPSKAADAAAGRSVTMSKNTLLEGLDRMGYKGRMTGHGFRSLASTILNEHDFDEAHIELQLAHMKRNKVAAAYNHAKYLRQRTVMMQWWADFLEQTQRGVKVLPFRSLVG